MKILAVLLLIFICLTACKSPADTPQSPDMAKSMLKLRGYDIDVDSFFRAIKSDDIIALKSFYESGIDANSQDSSKQTALIYAIQNAETKTVKVLIEKADMNRVDGNGNSPTHFALQKNKDEIVDLLLEKGADVNVAGVTGSVKNQSILYLAVTRGREDLIPRLLEKGANPNLADSEKSVPLIEACIGGASNPEIVKLLLEKGASVNSQESNGATALMYAASNNKLTSEKRIEIIKLLLAKGANPKLKDKSNKTAFDYAKEIKKTDTIELLK
jgi:uncharacterized protein